ncbi:MAG: hydrogenase maturation nickel metallochaperone HypA [Candidatus Marinimicrobia bacterium]|nr:hydrogenase maturation nickel metallochaperone HypA [Candidatus Neomarinimicrobiota bacterium]
MHELTIARNIIQIVENELKKKGNSAKVKKVSFKAGALNAIIPESLVFGFDILKKDSELLRDSELIVEEIPLKVKCRACGTESVLDGPFFFCSNCGSGDVEVVEGEEMFVESVELYEPEEESYGD